MPVLMAGAMSNMQLVGSPLTQSGKRAARDTVASWDRPTWPLCDLNLIRWPHGTPKGHTLLQPKLTPAQLLVGDILGPLLPAATVVLVTRGKSDS
jgi:hypothetical protein